MTRRQVLFVAYYFPPLGGIGSLRALKLATHLTRFGWQATVLAPRDGAYHRDPGLVFPERHVVRTGSCELSRLGKRAVGSAAGDNRPARLGTTLARVRKWVRRWLYVPDAQIGWYPFAVHAGRHLLREAHFDTIFSSSFPVTAHLVARRLARDAGLPWIAEFRDPWTDAAEYDSRVRARLDRAVETSILKDARAVVTVSERWADLLRSRGARDVTVITNGFDPADLADLEDEPQAAHPTATYLGSYYPGLQDLGTPLRALTRLRARDVPDLRVLVVGQRPGGLDEELAALGNAVVCTGFVRHAEALRLVSGSSLLLLAGPRRGEDVALGHIAAKVFEYLGSRRPILYVGHPEADMARLLRPMAGVEIVAPGQTDAAERAIRRLLAHRELRRSLTRITHEHLAGRLAGLLAASADRNWGRRRP